MGFYLNKIALYFTFNFYFLIIFLYKMASKYNVEKANQAADFILHYVTDAVKPENCDEDHLHEWLKDGIILCKLINAIEPGSVKKINNSNMNFRQMENIGKFLEGAKAYGVKETDLFQTVSLYENQNMAAVVMTIHALGRKAGSKGKHGIGPKEPEANKREFTDEQMRAGSNVIGLQMGSNKGASQAG